MNLENQTCVVTGSSRGIGRGIATDLGDHATAEILREILVQTEEDAHHIEHYLEDDTLVTRPAIEK